MLELEFLNDDVSVMIEVKRHVATSELIFFLNCDNKRYIKIPVEEALESINKFADLILLFS